MVVEIKLHKKHCFYKRFLNVIGDTMFSSAFTVVSTQEQLENSGFDLSYDFFFFKVGVSIKFLHQVRAYLFLRFLFFLWERTPGTMLSQTLFMLILTQYFSRIILWQCSRLRLSFEHLIGGLLEEYN